MTVYELECFDVYVCVSLCMVVHVVCVLAFVYVCMYACECVSEKEKVSISLNE